MLAVAGISPTINVTAVITTVGVVVVVAVVVGEEAVAVDLQVVNSHHRDATTLHRVCARTLDLECHIRPHKAAVGQAHHDTTIANASVATIVVRLFATDPHDRMALTIEVVGRDRTHDVDLH